MEELREAVERANHETVERMMETRPVLVGVEEARNAISFLRKEFHLTHAGPPIEWERASGPLRGAIIGAALYEGWADSVEEAERLAERGEIVLAPNHHYSSVGPMAGVISPSMKVFVVRDGDFYSYTNLNEGLGRVLRYGAYSDDVLERLRFLNDVVGSSLATALEECVREKNGVDLRNLIAQAIQMGDECHNRNVAATSLFYREISPYIIRSCDRETAVRVLSFIDSNNHFFVNLAMAACKLMADRAHGVEYSTIVTAISRNGTEVGIRVGGLGAEWFTAEAPIPRGLYFPGFSESDANPDIGDSTITETAGIGSAAIAASPAIVRFVGGDVKTALEITRRMGQICHTRHRYFTIPYLDFEGTPTGIDIRKVLKLGLTPVADTGIAHRSAGVGQIGAGIVEIPAEPFKKALRRYAEVYGLR
ncbi:hypothetical protein HRbin01_01259 [archaeon HR01]|nr:hypothetical protein HRbin01_01259 [archaeon HR01]